MPKHAVLDQGMNLGFKAEYFKMGYVAEIGGLVDPTFMPVPGCIQIVIQKPKTIHRTKLQSQRRKYNI